MPQTHFAGEPNPQHRRAYILIDEIVDIVLGRGLVINNIINSYAKRH